ncbi:MAG: TerB family tellurite resistance protein [Deltaproteobacteria bacterium]|nr:TerB family tellurite resistance protein [Deltaproteobacteria bacterium]
MNAFFGEVDLTFDHVKAITRAMFALAKVDGLHERELGLIQEFYDGCARAGDPSIDDVVTGAYDHAEAAKLFNTRDLAQLFVKNMMLLAFADGVYAREEDSLLREWAKGLGLSGADVDALHESTKEFLLGSLAHIENIDALREVAKRLDLT